MDRRNLHKIAMVGWILWVASPSPGGDWKRAELPLDEMGFRACLQSATSKTLRWNYSEKDTSKMAYWFCLPAKERGGP